MFHRVSFSFPGEIVCSTSVMCVQPKDFDRDLGFIAILVRVRGLFKRLELWSSLRLGLCVSETLK